MNAVVLPEDFDTGLTFYEVSPRHGDALAHLLVPVQGRCLTTTSGTTPQRGGCGRHSHSLARSG